MSIETVIHQLEEAKQEQQLVKGNELQSVEVEETIHECKEIVFLEVTRLTRHHNWKDDPVIAKHVCRLGAILWDKYATSQPTVELCESS